MNLITKLQHNNKKALTIYFPFRQEGEAIKRTQDQQTKLKGLVEGFLRDNQEFSDYKDLRLEIVRQITGIGGSLDYDYDSIAIFVSFDFGKKEPVKDFIEYIEFVHLPYIVEKKVCLGDDFDLDRLKGLEDVKDVLGVEIARNAARIRLLKDNELQEIDFVENAGLALTEPEREIMKNYQSGYGWWNTGEDKEWIEEEQKRFLKQIVDTIKSFNCDQIVFFMSSNYEKMKPEVESILEGVSKDYELIFRQPDESADMKKILGKYSTKNVRN